MYHPRQIRLWPDATELMIAAGLAVRIGAVSVDLGGSKKSVVLQHRRLG